MLEHSLQRLPEALEILIREARLFGERGGDKAVPTVEAICDRVLTAYGALFLDISLICYSQSSDGHFACEHRLNRARKGELHRPAHLAHIDARAHHRTERTHIEIPPAHFIACLLLVLSRVLLIFDPLLVC